ncbi:MAG: hypothetical protein AB7G37_10765 [Solirubrobacteraceae bacterium]
MTSSPRTIRRRRGPRRSTLRRIGPALDWTLSPSRVVGERPGWRASTLHARAIYPAMASTGLGPTGVYLGRDVFGSGFCFDPWHAYAAGLIGNPNILILGSQSMGKSLLVKTYLLRQYIFGRRAELIDVKDEYGPLIEAIGGSTLSVYRGGPTRLNPVRPGPDGEPAQELVAAVAAAGLARPLDPAERVGLAAAVDAITTAANGERREPTLPELFALLLDPPGVVREAMRSTGTEEPRRELRTLGLGLKSLCDGPLHGMFDGPTTATVDWNAPAIRLDLSQVRDPTAMGVLMTCWMAFLRQHHEARLTHCQREGIRPAKTTRVNEEGWRVAPVEGVAQQFTAEFKLSRKHAISQVLVLHKLTDAAAGADDGTAVAKLMDALLADIDTHVVHQQDDTAVGETTTRLGMSETQRELLTDLRPLQALWQVGALQFLVTHEISSYEAPIVDTDHAMRTTLAPITECSTDSPAAQTLDIDHGGPR